MGLSQSDGCGRGNVMRKIVHLHKRAEDLAVERVVRAVLAAESDERATRRVEQVRRTREVEVVTVRLVRLVAPAHLAGVEVERDDGLGEASVAFWARHAVAGADEDEPALLVGGGG